MSGLPEIVRGAVRYRFGLTPEAAACIAGALLADGTADRLRWLTCGLTQDPPLALWCALQAPEPATGVSAVASLGDWLAERLPRDFSELPPDPAVTAASANRAVRVQDLLVRSRAVAQAAGESSAADVDTAFVGLLHRAIDWLILSGTPRPKAKDAEDALPRWLASLLAQLKKPANCTPGSAEARVRTAIAAAADGAVAPADSGAGKPGGGKPGGGNAWPLGPDALAQFIPQLAAQAKLREQQAADFERAVEHAKLEALKEFAYGAGHEINNPLANISARAQTLLKEEPDPERRQKLAAINTQAFRAHEMIADLMLFARPPEMKPQRIELATFLSSLAQTWKDQAHEQQTEIELQVCADSSVGALTVWADSDALAVALRALVINALEALGRGGRVEVAARPANSQAGSQQRSDDRPDAVEISVSDNGPGIPPAIRARLFDPYFSGREAGRGLGFGLCKCWRIVTAQGGRIDVALDVAAGATFTLTLPVAPSAQAP